MTTRNLRVGTARACITPPSGIPLPVAYTAREPVAIRGKHDDLWAKAVVLEDGATRVAIVSADLVLLRNRDVTRIKERIQEGCGIPGDHILVACTHTHSAGDLLVPFGTEEPPWFRAQLDQIAAAVCEAATTTRRVGRVLWSAGTHQGIAYNRRLLLDDVVCMLIGAMGIPGAVGTKLDQLATSLGVSREALGAAADLAPPASPVDNEMQLLVVEQDDGTPAASIINCACHPTTLSFRDRYVSGEYPGYLMRLVEQELGGTSLFLQGCSGDVRPFYREASYSEVLRTGRAFGGVLLRMVSDLEELPGEFSVASTSSRIELPLKSHLSWDAMKARTDELRSSLDASRTQSLEATPKVIRERWQWMQTMRELEYQLQWGDREFTEDERRRERVAAEFQCIRLGNVAVYASPGEVFAQTGIALRDAASQAGWSGTMIATTSNGWISYVPPYEAAIQGGYEPSATWLAPGTCELMVKTLESLSSNTH